MPFGPRLPWTCGPNPDALTRTRRGSNPLPPSPPHPPPRHHIAALGPLRDIASEPGQVHTPPHTLSQMLEHQGHVDVLVPQWAYILRRGDPGRAIRRHPLYGYNAPFRPFASPLSKTPYASYDEPPRHNVRSDTAHCLGSHPNASPLPSLPPPTLNKTIQSTRRCVSKSSERWTPRRVGGSDGAPRGTAPRGRSPR